MFDCYNHIIGYSQYDCECSQGGRPDDYDTSNSGLFLDELAPIDNLVSVGKCDTNIWTIMQSAMTNGINRFVADSNALLGDKFTLKRQPLSDQVIGQIKAKNIVSPDKNYAVVRIYCCPIRSGFFKLNKIGGVFSSDGTVQVSLYNNVDGLLSHGPWTINSVANKHRTVDVNLQLPTYSKYVTNLEYYLVYQFDSNNYPKDTKIDCGCGNWKPHFNTGKPYYNASKIRKNAPWSNYVMIGGTQINSLAELDDMDDNTSASNSMYGLTVDMDFGCKAHELLCKDSIDFDSNPLAMSLAFAIRYAVALNVADQILTSTVLSRANMVAREDWEDSKDDWNEKYAEHVNYIVDNASNKANSCFTCKDVLGATRQGLFS